MNASARYLVALPLLMLPAAARAQAGDVAAARTAAQSFFKGMLTRDTAALRRITLPGAVIVNPIRRQGALTQRVMTIDALARDVMKTAEPYDERMPASQVLVDGDIAHVWGRYTFRVGKRVTNCGRDSFQLVRTTEGWKISHITSTIETTGCAGMRPAGAPARVTPGAS